MVQGKRGAFVLVRERARTRACNVKEAQVFI